jgi:hypothetical protein
VAIFSAEYAARLWSCTSRPEFRHPVKGRLKVASQIMPLVDLFAILPFYLQVLIPGLDLRFVRALRLFRIFRVFRAGSPRRSGSSPLSCATAATSCSRRSSSSSSSSCWRGT